MNDTSVIIIGAGWAGLSAAKTLVEASVDFLILEASGQIGGRLLSQTWHGVPVEIGANWVAGTTGNPMWDLAQELNIEGKITDFNSYTFRDSNGENLTAAATETYEKVFHPAQDRVNKVIKDAKDKGEWFGADGTMRELMQTYGWNPKTPLEKAMDYWEHDFESGDIPERMPVSYGQYGTYLDFEPDEYFVKDKRGIIHMIESYSQGFLTKNDPRLKYNHQVVSITHDSDIMVIQTSDGQVYRGQYVIVTVSLGVLQHDVIKFEPSLPPWKRVAIKKHLMTSYIQVFLKFPSSEPRFWDDTEFIIYTHEQRGYYTVWINMEAKDMFPPGTNMLMVTVTDTEAERIDKLSDRKIQDEMMHVLRSMYGENIPDADDILVSKWHSHPFFYGCYANRPVTMTDEEYSDFQASVERVYFAGEACAGKYCGYMHGSYYSGIKTAKEVIKAKMSK